MVHNIRALAPYLWKVYQLRYVTSENGDEERNRDVNDLDVTDEQWHIFCDRHKHLECSVTEYSSIVTWKLG